MMDGLEFISDKIYNGFFVDLFVRNSNDVAIGMVCDYIVLRSLDSVPYLLCSVYTLHCWCLGIPVVIGLSIQTLIS